MLAVLFLGLFIAVFFELLGIGSIPVFAMLIIDLDIIRSKVPSFINTDIFDRLSQTDLALYGAIILSVIFFIKNIYLALLLYFQGKVIKSIRISLETRLFKFYTYADYSFHLQTNPAVLLRNIQAESSYTTSIIFNFVNLFREILVVFFMFVLLLVVDPMISLLVFCFLTFFVAIFFWLTNRKIEINGKIMQYIRGAQVKHINQSFGAIKEVKILSKEGFLEKIFKNNVNIFEKAFLVNYFLSSLPRLFLELIIIIALVIITTIFIFLDRSIITMIPLLSLLVVSAIRLLPSFNTISMSLASIKSLSPSYNLVVKEFKKFEKTNKVKKSNQGKEISCYREIETKDLDFRYNKTNIPSINNVNLSIKLGTKVGIIGNSGAGKSTLIDLVLGLLKPSKGNILADGRDIFENIQSWQNLIGYVPQDIYLLDDTIKKNIAFGILDEAFNSKNFERAIQISQLGNFIHSLPDGIETIIGHRGIRISGGQRQRIGIARALYNDQKILFLDEATNSLDIKNEKKIIENIFSFDQTKTLVLIAHRHETVKNCDNVFLMNEGKLIDQGKYEYLNDKYNLTAFIEKKTEKIKDIM